MEQRRAKDVRTNMSESLNAWVRPLNFFLNGLRPASHRFWVEEMLAFYNDNLEDIMPPACKGRGSTASRKTTKK